LLKRADEDMNRLITRTILFGAAALTLASHATAADMAARPEYKASAIAATPAFNWTGFYIGGTAGYGLGSNDGVHFTDFPPGSFATSFAIGQTPQAIGFRPKGFIGGGEAGYNWQNGVWVFGVEADISFANIKGSGSFFFPGSAAGAPDTTSASSSLDWLATGRGRVGLTPVDRWLVFGTGGVAFGQVNNQMSVFASNPGAGFLATLNGSHKSTRTGWVAGAGAQYAVTNNVLAKVEWLYYDLGTDTFSTPEVLNGTTQPFGLNSSFKTNGNIVRFGMDFRFGG
jgi:outer membrane immunogenic protein